MTTQETSLLIEAKNEIEALRNDNQHMGARLDMFDKMMLLFQTRPDYPSQGMKEDIVWKIDKHITEEENKINNLTNTRV